MEFRMRASLLIVLAIGLAGCASKTDVAPLKDEAATGRTRDGVKTKEGERLGLFSRKSPSAGTRLADAVAADAADAFARFAAKRGDESIVALALCSVDDAASPYIVGATLKDIGPITGTQNTWEYLAGEPG